MTFGIDPIYEYVEINLDSADAITAGNVSFQNSEFNVTPSIAKYSWPMFYFTSKKFNVVGMKILDAQIPFLYNNINGGNNDFILTINTTSYLLSIPPNIYTSGTQVAAAVDTLLATVNPSSHCTYDTTMQYFTFTTSGGGTWGLTFTDRATAFSVLGFEVTTYSAPMGTPIVSTRKAEWYGSKYLFINSKMIGPNINFNTTDGAVNRGISTEIARIPIDVDQTTTSYIHYRDPDPTKYFDCFIEQFDGLDLYLTAGPNQGQLPLNMNGHSWSCKLALIIYRSATPDLYKKPSLTMSRSKTIIG